MEVSVVEKWYMRDAKCSNRKQCTRTIYCKPKSIEVNYNKVQSSPSPLFLKVYPEFLENMKTNKRRMGTIGASADAFKQLIELIGDKPIGDYNNVDTREYRNALSKLPSNRTKNPK